MKSPIKYKTKKDSRKMRSNKKKEKVKKVIKSQSDPERFSKKSEEINSYLDIENKDWAGSLSASPLSFIQDFKCPNNEDSW